MQIASVKVILSTLETVSIKHLNILQVYETELEKIPEFKKFRDFCRPFKLSRGKNADEMETSIAGEFKVLYSLPAHQKSCFYLKAVVAFNNYLLGVLCLNLAEAALL